MAKREKNTSGAAAPPAKGFNVVTLLGVIVTVAGVFLWRHGNGLGPGTGDRYWWAGVVAIIIGLHVGFFSTMTRDQIFEWIRSEVVALSLALLIRWVVAEPYRIPSGSMETTLHGDPKILRGDRVFVNKWVYGLRFPFMNKRIWHGQDPERWDIVVFKAVDKNAIHKTLVKRIVALPGERVLIRDGKLHTDGKAVQLPEFMPPDTHYTSTSYGSIDPMLYGVRDEERYTNVPEGHYLVCGDNSGNSRDGRYFGWLPNEHIVGRVSCIWWPPPSWRDFTGFSQTLWWWILVRVLGVLLALRLFVGRSWAVIGPLGKGVDHLFVSYLSLGLRLPFTRWWLYRWCQPKRGELVLYWPRTDVLPSGTALVGRVAGLPGEKVSIKDGRLQIDGKVVEEDWARDADHALADPEAVYGKYKDKDHSRVPSDAYFVLSEPREREEEGEGSDSASDSEDARSEDRLDSRILGWVAGGDLVGRVTAVWWPPKRWRRI